jgi:hypothetical protein
MVLDGKLQNKGRRKIMKEYEYRLFAQALCPLTALCYNGPVLTNTVFTQSEAYTFILIQT